jgi:hypothetical protein
VREFDKLFSERKNSCEFFSVKLRGSDTASELAEPYFYYGQALLYLGLGQQQVFGSDIVKGWFEKFSFVS